MEQKLLSIQFPGNRINLIVKNNKIILLHNRKKVKLDWPYRETWSSGDKIFHSIHDEWSHWFLNEVIWRIHEDYTIVAPEELLK